MLPYLALFALLYTASSCAQRKINKQPLKTYELKEGQQQAYFADACYWCTEGIWESLEGIISVESGFVGGTYPERPSYANHGDFAEGNRIVYDPKKITYAQLVDAYFDGHSHGRSPDKGPSYRAIAFYQDNDEGQILTKRYDEELERFGAFKQEIKPFEEVNWFIGPKDHQDYLKRLEGGEVVPNRPYGLHESIPRRDKALEKITAKKKKKLTDEQAYILLKKGTERPFSSPLNAEKRSGVYVSAATGDTLFHSRDKFNSGTGWPSFDDATDKVAIGQAEQGGHEVIEKSTGYHLGHLFKGEGFTPKNARYCINGGSLIFIPDEK